MSQRLLKITIVLLGLSILAGIIFLTFLSLKVNKKELNKIENYRSSQTRVVGQEAKKQTVQPKPGKEGSPEISEKIILQDPFAVPVEIQNGKAVRSKPKNQFDFVGVIETDTNLVAMLKVQKNQEVLLVHEGEYVAKLGIEIRRIDLESLTYYRDGKEVVLSLGGIK